MLNNKIYTATTGDLPAIEVLVNHAFRGEESRKGWTHEADLISGNVRIKREDLQKMVNDKDSMILIVREDDRVLGCMHLSLEKGLVHLGMLSVEPGTQGKGIGKQLLAAADKWAREHKAKLIEMTVINVRKELIDWYVRHGYEITGETRPFHNDGKFGMPLTDLHFDVLQKKIKDEE